MATEQLRSIEGDTLDGLLWRERSLGPADLDHVFALNPGLAAVGAVLPIGTVVTIPESPAPTLATIETVQLWD